MSIEIVLNGDVYFGNVNGKIPRGKGKYTWSDGIIYEGDWENGKMTGGGMITWPSGKTGLGKIQYSNFDIYDGCWKEGVHEGSGKYTWCNGDMYIGNWKNGLMFGRGVMQWINADVFDGYWSNGYIHGSGVYRFSDGSYYFGMWTKGLKDGRGIFYPAGSKKKVLKDLKRSLSDKFSINTDILSPTSDESENVDDKSTLVCEREYIQGVLIKQRIKKKALNKKKLKRKFQMKEVKKKSSLDIFEGHKRDHLMLNLQLGIRYSVGKITPVPMREVRHLDFGEQASIHVYFPKKGSQLTPPHTSMDFYWKDYCPMVFRNLREMFKLDVADYMMSICGDDGLRELSSPGKSGSLFYLSHDDRFVIKTIRKSELKVLLKMLPSYYNHVSAHDNTLITKFYGMHEMILKGGKKVFLNPRITRSSRFTLNPSLSLPLKICSVLKISSRCHHGFFVDDFESVSTGTRIPPAV